MKNIKQRTMHLTVNRDGLVSLWDSAEQAKGVKDEAYVALELTAPQFKQLLLAQTEVLLASR